jgi:hypothetical protein
LIPTTNCPISGGTPDSCPVEELMVSGAPPNGLLAENPPSHTTGAIVAVLLLYVGAASVYGVYKL